MDLRRGELNYYRNLVGILFESSHVEDIEVDGRIV
jgi:hypothetical protein